VARVETDAPLAVADLLRGYAGIGRCNFLRTDIAWAANAREINHCGTIDHRILVGHDTEPARI
jgi:hypothetical protein